MGTSRSFNIGTRLETQSAMLEENCAVLFAAMDSLAEMKDVELWPMGLHNTYLVLSAAYRNLTEQAEELQNIAIMAYAQK